MTPIDNFEARMAAVAAAFNQAPDEGAGSQFDPPPDGEYQAILDSWDHFEGGTPTQAFIKAVCRVVNHPEVAGRKADIVNALEDPERIGWLKELLVKLGAREVCQANGWDFDHPQMFPALVVPGSPILRALVDTPVLIKVVTSDRQKPDGSYYRNVYLQQRLGPPGSMAAPTQQQMPVAPQPVQLPVNAVTQLPPSPAQYQSDVTTPQDLAAFPPPAGDPFAFGQSQAPVQPQQQAGPPIPMTPMQQGQQVNDQLAQQLAQRPAAPTGAAAVQPPQQAAPAAATPTGQVQQPQAPSVAELRAMGCTCPNFPGGQIDDKCPKHGIPF